MFNKSIGMEVCVTLAILVFSQGALADVTYTQMSTASGIKYQEVSSEIFRPNDSRDYTNILLSNGLEVILVSDKLADKSAATMAVNVGFSSEPKGMPGLAHFCEHMLFQGTEKYPLAGDFDRYLSKSGGYTSASTEKGKTSYFFDVHNGALEGGLDRFSEFFVNPLFSREAVDGEIKLLNYEFEQKMNSFIPMLGQVQVSVSDPNHWYNHFGSGNLKSLVTIPQSKGIDLVAELKRFHSSYYSAHHMKLAVVSNLSIDELKELVIPKFARISKHQTPKDTRGPIQSPFRSQDLGITINMASDPNSENGGDHLIQLEFPIPPSSIDDPDMASYMFTKIVNSETAGSLSSAITNQMWGTKAMASIQNFDGFWVYSITLLANRSGIDNYERFVKLIFEFIQLIKNQGITVERFNEMRSIDQIAHDYKPRSDSLSLALDLVDAMVGDKPRESLLALRKYPTQFNQKAFSEFLTIFKASNMRISTVSPTYASRSDLMVEPWYNAKYFIGAMSASLRGDLDAILEGSFCCSESNIKLPESNPWTPSNFDMVVPAGSQHNQDHPTLVYRTNNSSLIHSYVNAKEPKASVNLIFKYKSVKHNSVKNWVLNRLLLSIFRAELAETLSLAGNSGLSLYTPPQDDLQITIRAVGFNDHLGKLLKKGIETISVMTITRKKLEVAKELLVTDAQGLLSPGALESLAYDWLRVLLTQSHWSTLDIIEAIRQISKEDLIEYRSEFFSGSFIEAIALGNILPEEARELIRYAELKFNNNPQSQTLSSRSVSIPNHSDWFVKFPSTDSKQPHSAIAFYLELASHYDYKSQATYLVIANMFEKLAFDKLRTQEQLGYTVHVHKMGLGNQNGIQIYIESNHNPNFLESRIESFLSDMADLALTMSEKDFQSYVQAGKVSAANAYSNLDSILFNYAMLFENHQYDYARNKAIISELENLKQDDLVEAINHKTIKGGSSRGKLSLHFIAETALPSYEESLCGGTNQVNCPGQQITDGEAWKQKYLKN